MSSLDTVHVLYVAGEEASADPFAVFGFAWG